MAASTTSLRNALPRGTTLDDDAFAARHHALRRLLVAHVPVVAIVGVVRGDELPAVAAEAIGIGVLVALAGAFRNRRLVATFVAAGFALASASVVHLSGGAPEARFHLLAALAVVSLYQDWVPLATAVVLALGGHVAAAAFVPDLAFADRVGEDRPWLWAGINSVAVLAVAVVQVVLWRAGDAQHRKATQLAGELVRAQSQIEARESVSELFVNLARRNQALLDRQIDLIVGMEERETEPEQLAQLFQLDHLATRIRRNAESLLVLSGEEPARRWGRPVPLTDVVRAAVAEVEDYRRVDVLIDESVALVGRAVADFSHLLAELVENGLQFSPPDTRVRVTSMMRPDRSCVLRIEDRGIGLGEMDLSSANDLLGRPPEVDLRLSKRLGFHVVSRLAARYGLKVHLDTTPGGGVTASILAPEELLAPVDAPAPVAPTAAARPPRPVAAPPTVAGRPLAPAPQVAARPPVSAPASTPAPVPKPMPPAAAPPPAPSAPRPAAPPPVAPLPKPVPVPVASAAAPAPAPAAVVAGRVVVPIARAEATPGALPRRVPQASLNPQLRTPAQPHPSPAPVERRSADEVRSMLSRFQAGQARGREEATARNPHIDEDR